MCQTQRSPGEMGLGGGKALLPCRETEARSTGQRGSSTRAFPEPCGSVSFGVALRGLSHADTPPGGMEGEGEGCRLPQPPPTELPHAGDYLP